MAEVGPMLHAGSKQKPTRTTLMMKTINLMKSKRSILDSCRSCSKIQSLQQCSLKTVYFPILEQITIDEGLEYEMGEEEDDDEDFGYMDINGDQDD
jgi:hypothetical protein